MHVATIQKRLRSVGEVGSAFAVPRFHVAVDSRSNLFSLSEPCFVIGQERSAAFESFRVGDRRKDTQANGSK